MPDVVLKEQENIRSADAATNTSAEAIYARTKQAKVTSSFIFGNSAVFYYHIVVNSFTRHKDRA